MVVTSVGSGMVVVVAVEPESVKEHHTVIIFEVENFAKEQHLMLLLYHKSI